MSADTRAGSRTMEWHLDEHLDYPEWTLSEPGPCVTIDYKPENEQYSYCVSDDDMNIQETGVAPTFAEAERLAFSARAIIWQIVKGTGRQ